MSTRVRRGKGLRLEKGRDVVRDQTRCGAAKERFHQKVSTKNGNSNGGGWNQSKKKPGGAYYCWVIVADKLRRASQKPSSHTSIEGSQKRGDRALRIPYKKKGRDCSP